MLDGLGLAETTPGPLIMVTQFVGFLAAFRHASGLSPLAAGVLGGMLTTWVTFTPCFLWIFLGAPFVEALRGAKALAAALSGIGAAVVGVIMNLAVWFALHVLFRHVSELRISGLTLEAPALSSLNIASAALTLAAAVAAFRFKVGMIPLLVACSAIGVVYFLLTGANPAAQS
jgi:chromate transporter